MKISQLISTTALALGLAGSASALTATFNSNGSTTYSSGSITVSASAFAYYDSDTTHSPGASVVSRHLGSYPGGLGVDAGSLSVVSGGHSTPVDSPTDIPQHAIDNNNNGINNLLNIDMVLFTFSAPVNLSRLDIGYVSGDSEFRYWVSNTAGTTAASLFGSGGNGSSANGGALGTDVNGGSSADYYDSTHGGFSATNVSYLLVAAKPTGTNDYFKIEMLTYAAYTPPQGGAGVPDSGSTVALLGLALVGLGAAKRRFAA